MKIYRLLITALLCVSLQGCHHCCKDCSQSDSDAYPLTQLKKEEANAYIDNYLKTPCQDKVYGVAVPVCSIGEVLKKAHLKYSNEMWIDFGLQSNGDFILIVKYFEKGPDSTYIGIRPSTLAIKSPTCPPGTRCK